MKLTRPVLVVLWVLTAITNASLINDFMQSAKSYWPKLNGMEIYFRIFSLRQFDNFLKFSFRIKQ
jgi:flagellar biosynthesis protein FlhB